LECLGWLILGHSLGWWFSSLCCSQEMMFTTGTTLEVPQIAYASKTRRNNNNNNNSTIHKQQHSYPFESPIKFVFFIGLEGSGHHLMSSILQGSPAKVRIKSMESVAESRRSIQTKLFDRTLDGRGDKGLWNAHCNHKKAIDTVRLQQKLANKFKLMRLDLERHGVGSDESSSSSIMNKKKIIFPINTLGDRTGFGMVSYPNFGGKECRFLMYPNLDLFYDACDTAKVDCEHIYLYRDPLQILRSTVLKRQFNPNMNIAIHLYTTMLHVVASQLETYEARTLGCYGFYESSNDTTSWWDEIPRQFGWEQQHNNNRTTAYEAFINDVYRPPSPVVNESMVVSSEYAMYLNAMNKIHDRGVRICNDGLAKRKNGDY
jgi:hypothetical protein